MTALYKRLNSKCRRVKFKFGKAASDNEPSISPSISARLLQKPQSSITNSCANFYAARLTERRRSCESSSVCKSSAFLRPEITTFSSMDPISVIRSIFKEI